jgi:predicted nucleic acid-binding protein
MDFLADTVFLIDLWRERGNKGPATTFARTHSGQTIGICWVVLGEFLSGSIIAGQEALGADFFVGRYPVLHSSETVVKTYASLYARLKGKNQLLGSNDLWIAACASDAGIPLVTRNRREYDRIPDLKVLDYTRPAGSGEAR